MKPEIILPDTAALASMPTNELRKELARGLTITAEHLTRLAAIWVELQRRGEDLAELRSGLLRYLPLIASRRMRADLVVNYAGQAMLLSAISRLPLHEQDRLVATGTVPVMELNAHGVPVEAERPLNIIKSTEIQRAFADDSLRSPSEQVTMLLRNKTQSVNRERPRLARKVQVSNDGSYITVGSSAAALDKVIEAIGRHFKVSDLRAVIIRAERDGEGFNESH